MLQELHIQDFAIIDQVALHFDNGFNIITGETGAGKSILIDAVDFALGGRADAGLIRAGAKRAYVELMFSIPPVLRSEIQALLEDNEVRLGQVEHLTLSRELRDNGRSSAKINDQTIKITPYREVGELLLNIHGQNDHLTLMKPKSHLYLLDSFGGIEDLREAVAEQYRKYRAIRQTMDSLRRSEREREQRIDMLKFQIEEIESAKLKDGEEATLREERTRLANSEKLATLTEDAYQSLYGEDEFGKSGLNALHRAVAAIGKLAQLDPQLAESENQAQLILEQTEELTDTLRLYRDRIDVSPARLDQVEERLEVIQRLKRRYGDSIKLILETAERAHQELEDIEMGEERLGQLEHDADILLRSIGELSRKLSQRRRTHGDKLAGAIEAELGQLKMEGARFQVSITQEEDEDGCYVEEERLAFDGTGIDQVEFLLSANPGEPLRPLAQVASGGETARIMLALKTVLSLADRTPTLIFDEVDQGIGARLGMVIGQKLWGIAEQHQVLVVTHLAQIAGFADTHFKVSKAGDGKRTTAQVNILKPSGRVQEIAEMLGGISESALQNAQELYDAAQQIKTQKIAHKGQVGLPNFG